MVTPASAGMLAARPVPRPAAADERAALMQRMKADWCGFGAAEYGRQSDAVIEQASTTGNRMFGREAVAELKRTPGQQVVDETVEQVRRRWVKALMLRGDPRSRAVAELLSAAGEDGNPARVRLQALARTTSDPMVTALALQRPCDAGSCRNVEASQWSRLEPANLQAWLTLLRDPDGKLRQTHAAYALDRLVQEARYSRNYQHEFHALLLSLPQTESPGLQNEAEIQLIGGMVSAWPWASMRPLLDTCRGGLADAVTAPRCEAVARLLWQQEDSLNRGIALGLVRALVAARPGLRPQWELQAREYEAVDEWVRGAPGRVAGRISPESMPHCGWQAEMRRMWRESVGRGEWEILRGEMREAGEDASALSARWRQREGRSALDPRPPARAASAASG